MRFLLGSAHGDIDDPDVVFDPVGLDPVQCFDYLLLVAIAAFIQHLHCNDIAARRYAFVFSVQGSSAAGQDSGHMRAVSIVIIRKGSSVYHIKKSTDSAVKIYMRINSGVQDGDTYIFSGKPFLHHFPKLRI